MKFEIIHHQGDDQLVIDLDLSERGTKKLVRSMLKQKASNSDIIKALVSKSKKFEDMFFTEPEHPQLAALVLALDGTLDRIKAYGWKPEKWPDVQKRVIPKLAIPKTIVRG